VLGKASSIKMCQITCADYSAETTPDKKGASQKKDREREREREREGFVFIY